MVSVKYHTGMNESLDAYYTDLIEVTQSSKTKAVYHDPQLFNSIVIEGEKLKFKDGDLVSGTVDKVTFKDGEGLTLVTFKGEYKDFDQVDDMFGSGFFDHLMFTGSDKIVGSNSADLLYGYNGKDKINGRAGEDQIWNGKGKDQLTGGADSDTFYFYDGDGHDVLTDFDAIGLDGEQDFLNCDLPVTTEKSGKNTVLTFEGGDTVTLLGVKPGEITEADFVSLP